MSWCLRNTHCCAKWVHVIYNSISVLILTCTICLNSSCCKCGGVHQSTAADKDFSNLALPMLVLHTGNKWSRLLTCKRPLTKRCFLRVSVPWALCPTLHLLHGLYFLQMLPYLTQHFPLTFEKFYPYVSLAICNSYSRSLYQNILSTYNYVSFVDVHIINL